jgi:hypothetical protein
MLLGAGHRGILLHRRSFIAVYLAFGALASFRGRHQYQGHIGSVFAIGLMRHSDEPAMEACQIGFRPESQGCQACRSFFVSTHLSTEAASDASDLQWKTLSPVNI